MTEDIVKQLRIMEANAVAKWLPSNDAPLTVAGAAADEIERLRIEYSLWKMTAEHLARQLGKMEYADAAYQDIVDSIERTNEVFGEY